MSEWISVKDQLPKDGETVLVFCDDIYFAKFIEVKDKRLKQRKGHFELSDDFLDEDPTHWMPLPEKPNE